jgi:hypothetical protein
MVTVYYMNEHESDKSEEEDNSIDLDFVAASKNKID